MQPATVPAPRPYQTVNTQPVGPKTQEFQSIRTLAWVYAFLLIFEGAFRKWIFQDFSDLFLLARDPVVLGIYILAIQKGLWPANWMCSTLVGLAILSGVVGAILNPSYPLVTLYGIKANFLHLPLILIIPKVFDQRHILKVGTFFMWCGILMTPLVIMQFRTGPNSVWNLGPGGSLDSQIYGAMGKIRPPGVFSFITGLSQFCAIQAAFTVFGFIQPKAFPRWLTFLSTGALMLILGLSISRLTIGCVAVVVLTAGVLPFFHHSFASRLPAMLAILGVMFIIVSSVDLFKEGGAALGERLVNTGDMHVGAVGASLNWSQRFFFDFTLGFEAMGTAPILGYGSGYGTNVGARILGGRLAFLLAEGEWARVILELGPLIGACYLALRVNLSWLLVSVGMQAAKQGNALPLLLAAAGGLTILQGQFGQPTSAGFAAFGGALCLAAANADIVEPPPPVAKKVRSRSRYAEFLFGS